jgi:hypothetical protein
MKVLIIKLPLWLTIKGKKSWFIALILFQQKWKWIRKENIMELWHLKQQIILSLNPCDLHKPSWTCIWYFVSQPLWLANQVEPVFGILSLNPCDSQTKLNLYLVFCLSTLATHKPSWTCIWIKWFHWLIIHFCLVVTG